MSVNHPLPWRAERSHPGPTGDIWVIDDANGYRVCDGHEDTVFEIVEAVNSKKRLECSLEKQARIIDQLLTCAPPAPVVFPASLLDQFRGDTKKEATKEELAQEITKAVLRVIETKDWAKREPVTEDTSDGFHTFKELYRYRMLYNAAFFNLLAAHTDIPVVKSWRHGDGEPCFGGGWFIVVAQLPTGQISNHYEAKDWDLFDIPAVEKSPTWDGHTPNEAANSLEAFLMLKTKRKDGEE